MVTLCPLCLGCGNTADVECEREDGLSQLVFVFGRQVHFFDSIKSLFTVTVVNVRELGGPGISKHRRVHGLIGEIPGNTGVRIRREGGRADFPACQSFASRRVGRVSTPRLCSASTRQYSLFQLYSFKVKVLHILQDLVSIYTLPHTCTNERLYLPPPTCLS